MMQGWLARIELSKGGAEKNDCNKPTNQEVQVLYSGERCESENSEGTHLRPVRS
jgi:hypothetical protein